MSDVVIQCDGLGKRYRIRHQQAERYKALRDVLTVGARNLLRPGRASRPEIEDFWALEDVSFEVRRGEVLGIIGRNGAGKSTLLKILSRITEPTRGRVVMEGRVASLLEVGTGFHPELTGRENIYLNGAILGMSRAEIKARFDEIVAFAEVERFLDTPVKRYSSGMYVRLAFAVAAHLEPEILIIDEVLAVGDAEFQRKCLGKMQDVSSDGRTVLFVSHQMASVQKLCSRGLLLASGRVQESGPIAGVVQRYLSESSRLASISLDSRVDRQGTGALRFRNVTFMDAQGNAVQGFVSGSTAVIRMELANAALRALRPVHISLGIDDDAGQRIAWLSTSLAGRDLEDYPADAEGVSLTLPRLPLCPGRYGFTLFCSVNGEIADWVRNAGAFVVEPGDYYGTGQVPLPGQGHLMLEHRFEVALP